MKLSLPKLSGSSKMLHYGDRMNPARDWMMLVSVSGLLLLVSLGWNVWLFDRVTKGAAIGTATAAPSLNPASIDPVNALFENRATKETDYKNSHFVDPSVPGR